MGVSVNPSDMLFCAFLSLLTHLIGPRPPICSIDQWRYAEVRREQFIRNEVIKHQIPLVVSRQDIVVLFHLHNLPGSRSDMGHMGVINVKASMDRQPNTAKQSNDACLIAADPLERDEGVETAGGSIAGDFELLGGDVLTAVDAAKVSVLRRVDADLEPASAILDEIPNKICKVK